MAEDHSLPEDSPLYICLCIKIGNLWQTIVIKSWRWKHGLDYYSSCNTYHRNTTSYHKCEDTSLLSISKS